MLARSASLRSSAAVVAMSGDKTFGLEWVVLGDAGFVFTPPGGNAPRIPPLEQGREDSLPDVPSDEGDLISLPSLLCLSDLFRPGNRTDERAVFSDKPLCTGGASYSGPELRQDDLVNLSQIIGYADGAPEGSSLTFSGYAFLRDASAAAMKPGGASTSSGRYEDLRASLARLSTASLSFSGVEGCQGFPLLEHFESGPSAQRGKANRITVRVSPGRHGSLQKGGRHGGQTDAPLPVRHGALAEPLLRVASPRRSPRFGEHPKVVWEPHGPGTIQEQAGEDVATRIGQSLVSRASRDFGHAKSILHNLYYARGR